VEKMKKILAIGIVALLVCGIGLAGTALAMTQKDTPRSTKVGDLNYIDSLTPTANAYDKTVNPGWVTIDVDWNYGDTWDWDAGYIYFELSGPCSDDDEVYDRKGPNDSTSGTLQCSFYATSGEEYNFLIKTHGKGKSAQDTGTITCS
jgi:hypothetical protein